MGLQQEVWKDITGYEGRYQVSNFGRVKSLPKLALRRYGTYRRVSERILKPQQGGENHYLHVSLRSDNTAKIVAIHILVARAFIPNHKKLPQINHKDENKYNNNAENLEWCSAKYNANYGTSKIRLSEKAKKPVLQYTLDGKFVAEYESVTIAGQKTKMGKSLISGCCNGKYKQAKGYVFKFKKEVK